MSELVVAECPSSLASASSAARRRRERRYRAAFVAGARCIRGGAPGLSVFGFDIKQNEGLPGTGAGAGENGAQLPSQKNEADYPRGRLCNSDGSAPLRPFGGPWVDGPARREPQLDSTRARGWDATSQLPAADPRVALPASGSSMATDTNSPRFRSGAILVAGASAADPPGQTPPLQAQEKRVLQVLKLLNSGHGLVNNQVSLYAKEGAVSQVRKHVAAGQSIVARGVVFDPCVLTEALLRWESAACDVQHSSTQHAHTQQSAQDTSHDEQSLLHGNGHTLDAGVAHASREAPAASPSQITEKDTSPKQAERKWEVDSHTVGTAAGRRVDRTASTEAGLRDADVSWLLEQVHGVMRGPKRYFFRRPAEHEHAADAAALTDDDIDAMDTSYEVVAELSNHSLEWVQIEHVLEAAENKGRDRDVTALTLQNWCILNVMSADLQRALIRFTVQPLRAKD